MDVIAAANQTAERLLARSLPRRWRHVQSVAAKAASAGALLLSAEDQALATASAWLHDVGYAPELIESGLHPLDGARWLRREGIDGRICALVAHHSCAAFEAQERGLLQPLVDEFARDESLTADVLWWADMTTGPDGQDFDVVERLAEIRARYGPDDIVTRFWARCPRRLKNDPVSPREF